MKLKTKIFFLILIGVLGMAENSEAAIINAASCSQANVQSAINAANAGDTVNVPAGSCSWSGMTIAKAIHLKGAGTGQANISVSENTVTKQSAGVVRISHFSFSKSGGANESKGFTIDGSWKNAEPVIFERNAFTVSGSGMFVIRTAGGIVIAGNAFTGGWDDSFIQPKDISDSGNSWGSADTMGNRDTQGKHNIYVEDNTFYGGTNQGIDCDDASRCVYRHNTLTYSSFNTHGLDTSHVGVRHFEVYANNFIHDHGTSAIANQNWLIWIRGGTGVIFGNAFANVAGSYWGDKSELKFSIRGAEDVRPQGSCASVIYPVPRQIGQNHNGTGYFTDPVYIWGNTGAQAIDAGWHWGNPCGLTFSNFWQSGRDYVTGSAKPNYTSYVYPHPLRNGSESDPTPPASPGGLVVR